MSRIIDGMLTTIGLKEHRSIGVALSGGGARGFAHIGLFMALEKFGLRPDIISGVSSGSIAAVLYASGLTPKEMTECFAALTHLSNYMDITVPRGGFFRLTKFGKIIGNALPVRNLEELKIPTIVCATDLENANSVGWAKGEIIPRVLASCSIPVIFQPIKINGVHYVDGGVLRNLPAWAIRDRCKILIGSNCSPLNRHYKYKASLIDTTLRSFQMMMKANVLQDLNLCDYVVQNPELAEFSTFDVAKMHRIIESGYDTACRIIEKMTEKK